MRQKLSCFICILLFLGACSTPPPIAVVELPTAQPPAAPKGQEPATKNLPEPTSVPPVTTTEIEISGKRIAPEDLQALLTDENRVLARVNEKEILASELCTQLFFHFASQADELLRKMIGDQLARLEAVRNGITVTEAEVAAAIQEGIATLREQVAMEYANAKTLEEFLAQDLRTSLDSYESALRVFVLGRFFLERVIRFDQLSEERVVCRIITVETEQKAKELLLKLQEGADFQVLARQESLAPNNSQGGLLPPFGPSYQHVISPIAFTTAQGGVAGPIVEQKGGKQLFHIIRVIEKIPARTESYAELEAEIIMGLRENPIADWEYFSWSQKMEQRYKVELLSK